MKASAFSHTRSASISNAFRLPVTPGEGSVLFFRGGVTQGHGAALYEKCISVDHGQLTDADMADYLVRTEWPIAMPNKIPLTPQVIPTALGRSEQSD